LVFDTVHFMVYFICNFFFKQLHESWLQYQSITHNYNIWNTNRLILCKFVKRNHSVTISQCFFFYIFRFYNNSDAPLFLRRGELHVKWKKVQYIKDPRKKRYDNIRFYNSSNSHWRLFYLYFKNNLYIFTIRICII